VRHIVYLHGFASSPTSAKRAFFAERLAAFGLELRCPDFNEPDFHSMTTTRMIGQLERELEVLPPAPVALIGSSLGGFVALHAAARQARARRERQPVRCPIDRLVLLAPALAFGRTTFGGLDEAGLAEWKRTDRFDVFHHAYKAVLPIGFALYEDAGAYDSFADPPRIPMLIVQGRRDTVVEPMMVERFAIQHPSASLRLVDDDHQLGASLDIIWRETAAFLGLCSI